MERSPELEAITRRMWDRFGAGDREALENLFVRHPGLRIILSGDDDWLAGQGLPTMMAQRAATMNARLIEIDRIEAWEQGNAGWSASQVTITAADGSSVTTRSTVAFVLDGGVWRAVQLHTSVGVPNEETFGAEISDALAELLDTLDAESGAALQSVAGSGGTVTLVFTDIEGSTAMSGRLGDAAWSAMLQDHFDEIERITTDHDGVVIKTLGDGAMAAFRSARAAVDASIALQQATEESDFRVRIGIHTGDAIDVGGDYVGLAVNKAARVASAADGGEILLSSATRELVGDAGHTFGDERIAELHGLDGQHRLTPVDWHE